MPAGIRFFLKGKENLACCHLFALAVIELVVSFRLPSYGRSTEFKRLTDKLRDSCRFSINNRVTT